MTESATEVHAARVVTPDGVLTGSRIVVEGERIAAIEPASTASTASTGAAGGTWAVPGFVDTHTHGAAGHDFGDASADGVRAILAFQRSRGATTTFASLATNTVERMAEQVTMLAAFVEAGELGGIHLEGPFLAPERRGAHAVELLRDPDPDTVDTLLAAGRGTVRMVTLAPERTHADTAIRQFLDAGVRVAFGHSDADASGCARMVGAGASVATHLFNAMRPIHHRDAGPVPVLLTDPRVAVELICDGIHLDREVIDMAVSAAGHDRVVLVTDAMAATGLGDGDYTLGALRARVSGGVARILEADGSSGAIAGSTLTMQGAVARVVAAGHDLPAAIRMASTTPARVHGLVGHGELSVGAYADIVVCDDAGTVQRVMRRGRWLDA